MRAGRASPLLAVLALTSMAGGARAQTTDLRPRADQSLSGLPALSSTFATGTIGVVVKPYQGTTPPQTGITASSIQSDVILKRITPSPEQRALAATEDSFLNRPQVSIAAGSPYFDDANTAIANAPNTLGGSFDPAGGLCRYSDFGQLAQFTRFCTRDPVVSRNTCQVTRTVTVDRQETYLCDQQDSLYIQGCTETLDHSCMPSPNCAANAVSATLVTGSGTVTDTGSDIDVAFIDPPRGLCVLGTQSVTLTLSSDIQLAGASIAAFEYSEWAQIVVNGTPIVTLPSGPVDGLLTTQRFRVNLLSTRTMPAINGARLASSCAYMQRTAGPIDLLPHLILPPLTVSGPVQSVTNIIEIRAVGRQPQARFTLATNGPCCDALQTHRVQTCDTISR